MPSTTSSGSNPASVSQQPFSFHIQCITSQISVLSAKTPEAHHMELQKCLQQATSYVHALQTCLILAERLQKDIQNRMTLEEGKISVDVLEQSKSSQSTGEGSDVVFIPYVTESKSNDNQKTESLIISSDIDSNASNSTIESILSNSSRNSQNGGSPVSGAGSAAAASSTGTVHSSHSSNRSHGSMGKGHGAIAVTHIGQPQQFPPARPQGPPMQGQPPMRQPMQNQPPMNQPMQAPPPMGQPMQTQQPMRQHVQPQPPMGQPQQPIQMPQHLAQQSQYGAMGPSMQPQMQHTPIVSNPPSYPDVIPPTYRDMPQSQPVPLNQQSLPQGPPPVMGTNGSSSIGSSRSSNSHHTPSPMNSAGSGTLSASRASIYQSRSSASSNSVELPTSPRSSRVGAPEAIGGTIVTSSGEIQRPNLSQPSRAYRSMSAHGQPVIAPRQIPPSNPPSSSSGSMPSHLYQGPSVPPHSQIPPAAPLPDPVVEPQAEEIFLPHHPSYSSQVIPPPAPEPHPNESVVAASDNAETNSSSTPSTQLDLDEFLQQPLKPYHHVPARVDQSSKNAASVSSSSTHSTSGTATTNSDRTPTNRGLLVLDELLNHPQQSSPPSAQPRPQELISFASPEQEEKDKILNLFNSLESGQSSNQSFYSQHSHPSQQSHHSQQSQQSHQSQHSHHSQHQDFPHL